MTEQVQEDIMQKISGAMRRLRKSRRRARRQHDAARRNWPRCARSWTRPKRRPQSIWTAGSARGPSWPMPASDLKKSAAKPGNWRTVRSFAKSCRCLDDLDRAIKTVPEDLRQHTWADGVALIQRKFQAVLESEGVKPIEVKPGDKFDPTWHEAVTHEENARAHRRRDHCRGAKGLSVRRAGLAPGVGPSSQIMPNDDVIRHSRIRRNVMRSIKQELSSHGQNYRY